MEAVVSFLAAATTLNFVLLSHLWRRKNDQAGERVDLLFPAGFHVIPFAGESRDGGVVTVSAGATAFALVFLTRGCPRCRTAAPSVEDAVRRIAGHDVDLWIITQEGLTASELDASPDLDRRVLEVSIATYAVLNPRRASPTYLFIAPDLKVEASGFIGDENWESFVQQLADST